jgi:transketolase
MYAESLSDLKDLSLKSSQVRRLLLDLHFNAKSGHVGSALSCAEILTFLRFRCMRSCDTLVLSKGHAASALYSALAVAGDINEAELRLRYYKDGTVFSAHPPPNKLSRIPFATGSLGHGPGICAGLALGSRLRGHHDERVYCVVSDGELNEGSVWEAFIFASHFKLDNLTFIIDKNGLQGFGRTTEVMNMESLEDKFRAFGLLCAEANGHDFDSLTAAYANLLAESKKIKRPAVIIANTVKGRGLPGLADTVDCHYLPMNQDTYDGVIKFCDSTRAANED